MAACTAAAAAFLAVQLTAWPPHEDETLALFVGRSSVGGLLDIVLGQRGGAPLHFLLAWLVAHAGGGLTVLRLLSAAFAVASIPVIALLCARLGGRSRLRTMRMRMRVREPEVAVGLRPVASARAVRLSPGHARCVRFPLKREEER